MVEFVLIVSFLGDFKEEEVYVGSFPNCLTANIYYESHFKGKENYNGYRCLIKNMIGEAEKTKLGI